jgi:hypothetical protein
MQDLPTISRMPGADGALDVDAFEPGEIAGMRSAGWILVGMGSLNLLGVLRRPSGVILTCLIHRTD